MWRYFGDLAMVLVGIDYLATVYCSFIAPCNSISIDNFCFVNLLVTTKFSCYSVYIHMRSFAMQKQYIASSIPLGCIEACRTKGVSTHQRWEESMQLRHSVQRAKCWWLLKYIMRFPYKAKMTHHPIQTVQISF